MSSRTSQGNWFEYGLQGPGAGVLPTAEQPGSAPVQPAPDLGNLGNYRLLRLLGQGGMSLVFEAEDQTLGRHVAVKVLQPDLEVTAEMALRFEREARLLAALKHEHVLTIYEAGRDGQVAYLVMELLTGTSLEQRLTEGPLPDLQEVVRIGQEIASGLAALHGHGLIHRDIKPGNIWLEAPAGHVKLLDLGLARAMRDDDQVSSPGIVLGTPAYMAPEQARGEPATPRSDLFSLGCVLYYLASGQKPFAASNTFALLATLPQAAPRPSADVLPGLPPALAELIMQLLAKEPADRPVSADLVQQRLRAMAARLSALPAEKRRPERPTHLPAHVAPPRTARGSRYPGQRWYVAVVAVLFASLALIGLAGAFFWPRQLALTPAASEPEPVAWPSPYLSDWQPLLPVNWPARRPTWKETTAKPGMPNEFFKDVRVRGQHYPRGIFMHPPMPPSLERLASLSYPLAGKYTRFQATVTLGDCPEPSTDPLEFSIHGDGKLLWKSQPVTSQNDAQPVDILVAGVKVLKLQVKGTDDAHGAHAVWLDPRVVR